MAAWRSTSSIPKNGRRVLLLCEFASGHAVVAARWDDTITQTGAYGRFAWVPDGGGDRIAEKTVKRWAPIPPLPAWAPSNDPVRSAR